MFFLYSIILTVAFLVLLPRFIFDAIFKGKYAAGFTQRLGFLPPFEQDGRPVIWVHCVSVGETNAARPLIQQLADSLPPFRLIVSTTTRTGQELARQVFNDNAELVFYFPFDWKFSVRRALRRFAPTAVMLLETEIWFNFLREANKSGAKVAIVNGRLSERSCKRFGYIKNFMRRVLSYPDLALMQTNLDAKRLMALGMRATKVKVTGNMKFDQPDGGDAALAEELARTAVDMARRTESPIIQADALAELASVLALTGQPEAAASVAAEATALYLSKGDLVAARLLAGWASTTPST